MNADQQNDWRAFYRAALLELDPGKLPERIERAESAIRTSLNAHPNADSTEYQDLLDAVANLRVLRREIARATDANLERNPPGSSSATSP
ncbi:MAG: hypothetical protein ABSA29_10495 [Terriglobales bacterium]